MVWQRRPKKGERKRTSSSSTSKGERRDAEGGFRGRPHQRLPTGPPSFSRFASLILSRCEQRHRMTLLCAPTITRLPCFTLGRMLFFQYGFTRCRHMPRLSPAKRRGSVWGGWGGGGGGWGVRGGGGGGGGGGGSVSGVGCRWCRVFDCCAFAPPPLIRPCTGPRLTPPGKQPPPLLSPPPPSPPFLPLPPPFPSPVTTQ